MLTTSSGSAEILIDNPDGLARELVPFALHACRLVRARMLPDSDRPMVIHVRRHVEAARRLGFDAKGHQCPETGIITLGMDVLASRQFAPSTYAPRVIATAAHEAVHWVQWARGDKLPSDEDAAREQRSGHPWYEVEAEAQEALVLAAAFRHQRVVSLGNRRVRLPRETPYNWDVQRCRMCLV